MYKKILIPLDGSKTSQRALDEAARLAASLGSEVHAIYVIDNSDMLYSVGYYDPVALHDENRNFGQKTLGAAAEALGNAGVTVHTSIIDEPTSIGDISGTILDEASREGAELIVIGTHGRRGVRRLVMGSVAEGVVRKAKTPVLLVHADGSDWE